MATKKKQKAIKSLAHGRPPILQKPKSISRKATRNLINSIHVLEKRKAQALSSGHGDKVAAIEAEIAALGGIDQYQQASLQGQRNDRGGDSSKVLLEWLQPTHRDALELDSGNKLRMLEVGALSTTNACSTSDMFSITRIDLNSQGEGILQQDFMERPLPKDDSERFDIVSLSLVLNFVPDAQRRGDMVLRVLTFLNPPSTLQVQGSLLGDYFPSLFLVLPAPCVGNSRYMDEARLEDIMRSLGFCKQKFKTTQKLVYYLWTRKGPSLSAPATSFTKTQVRTGRSRNNFAIVLHGPPG